MNSRAYFSSDNDTLKTVLSVLTCVLIGAVFCCILLVLSSFLFSLLKSTPQNFLSTLNLFISSLSAFISGFISAKIRKKNGLLIGACTGALLFMPIFITGVLMSVTDVSYISLIRLFAMSLAGSIGGVLGVNRKIKETF